MSSPVAPSVQPSRPAGPPIVRQFVSFAGYRLDPAFRRLSPDAKRDARAELIRLFDDKPEGLICLTYSTVGLKVDCDLMLWKIAATSDVIQQQSAAMNRSTLGAYLTPTHSFLAMTKRSQYVDKTDPFHDASSRTHIVPGRRKYLFIYPFVKTRQWYVLPAEKRQAVMDEHIRVGSKYPSVKLNTTYSFGLDDQDFVVAFETDEPKDFLDLVMELREGESSLYTVRDTPIFTCVQKPMSEILDELF